MSAAGIAAPPTVVKSKEVAGVVVAKVSAVESESTIAVEPAEQALSDATPISPNKISRVLILL